MLDFSVTQKEDSIENIFCKSFDSCKKRNMNDLENNMFPLFKNMTEENFEQFPIAFMMSKRIQNNHTFTIECGAVGFLSIIANNFGYGVMICWYLQYLSKTKNIKHFDLDTIGRIFDGNVPVEQEWVKHWLGQKVNRSEFEKSDNLLDYGCAVGFLISGFKKLNIHKIYGFDISEWAIDESKKKNLISVLSNTV